MYVARSSNKLTVTNHGEVIAEVDEKEVGVLMISANSGIDEEIRVKLLDILVKYSKTNLKERL